jgi:hypothetical protein
MVRIHPDPPTKSQARGMRREGCRSPGAIAQLGERLLCKQEVIGSIPIGSTSNKQVTRSDSRGISNQCRERDVAWCFFVSLEAPIGCSLTIRD